MPALRVSVDGSPMATVSAMLSGVISTSVHGTKIDQSFAQLEVTGGSHPEGGPSTYLIWVNELGLSPGQAVVVEFLADALNSHSGQTIEQLFPDAEIDPPSPELSPEEIINELRTRPRSHNRFAFDLTTSSGATFVGEAPVDAHGFGFSVLWNWLRPERVSVSLHTYTLDDLLEKRKHNDLLHEYISVGGSARLTLVA